MPCSAGYAIARQEMLERDILAIYNAHYITWTTIAISHRTLFRVWMIVEKEYEYGIARESQFFAFLDRRCIAC